MAILSLSLGPEAVGKLYDALSCLGRFNESVCFEATKDNLTLYGLNSTQSAYAAFSFSNSKFFFKYVFSPPQLQGQYSKDKFSCKVYNRSLLSIFKGRTIDPQREKDTAIDRCDLSIEDGEGDVESHITIRLSCRNGVLKTYRLTFESIKAQHALFNVETARNRWSISSRVLREFVDHFGPKTEQLDIYSEEGRVTFVSYTEKIVSGNEILRQPLHTSVAIDTLDFSDFHVEDKLHIVISVKDFKSMVLHAGITATTVSAAYSHPLKPLQIKYSEEGMSSEFILMTSGSYRGTSATPALGGQRNTSKSSARPQLEASSNRNRISAAILMPPPSRSAAPSILRGNLKPKIRRPSPPPPQPSLQSDALFNPDPEDDGRWDPVGYDEEDEETLGWDVNANDDNETMTLSRSNANVAAQRKSTSRALGEHLGQDTEQLDPTQRLSGLRGIFDN